MRMSLFWLTPFLLASAAVPAQQPFREPPSFVGKTLGEWSEALDDADPRVRCRAATALGLGPFGKTAVPALLRALGDTDRKVRLSAIEALGYLGSDGAAAVPFLKELIGKDTPWVAYRCLVCLGRIGPAALHVLGEVLQEGHGGTRVFAAEGLAVTGEAAMPTLTAALQHSDPAVRKCVIHALSNHSALASSLLPGLMLALHSKDGEERMTAWSALARLKLGASVPVSEMAKLLRDEEYGDVAAGVLGQFGKRAFPCLQRALRDTNPAVRARGVVALARLGPQALPLLRAALKDSDPTVRCRALEGLVNRCGAKAVFPLLKEALKDHEEEIRITALARMAQASPVNRETILLLKAALNDPSNFVQFVAARWLDELGPAAAPAIPALVADLQRKEERRWWTARMLGKIGLPDRAAVRALCAALRDRDADVRIEAATALGRIGPRSRQVRDVTGGQAAMEAEIVIPALRRALRDRDASVRAAAALALWRVGERLPETLRLLTHIIADGRAGSAGRKQAVRALAALGPAATPAVPVLIDALQDNELRYCAAGSLGAIGSAAKQAIPALANLMQESPPGMAHYVGRALARIGPAAVPALRKALAHEDADMRAEVCQAAELLGPAGRDMLPALVQTLHDSTPRVRVAAVRTTRRLRLECAAAILALASATADRDEQVRQAACMALGELGPASRLAIPALATALLDDSAGVRLAAAQALQRIGPASRQVLPVLIDLLSARDRRLALAIAETVGGLGAAGRPALPALDALLTTRDGEMRVAAAVAVWKITRRKEKILPVLLKGLKDADASTRLAAALALRKIEPSKPVVSVLVSLLREEPVRQRAAERLEALCPPAREVAPALRVLLEHRDSDVRLLALRLLEKLAPKVAFEDL